jgi:hypothetical protein
LFSHLIFTGLFYQLQPTFDKSRTCNGTNLEGERELRGVRLSATHQEIGSEIMSACPVSPVSVIKRN